MIALNAKYFTESVNSESGCTLTWRTKSGGPLKSMRQDGGSYRRRRSGFVRTPGMLALPVPETGGSIETLRSLVNVADEQDFVLVVAWLLAAMHRNIPKPIMAIRGGEGSAKSTLVEILRRLIDPHDPPYTALPRTEIKLRSTAAEAYCQAYDNISGLTVSMSDALCRFVTDGSNQPVIINGISDIITRPDLADRCVFIDCAPIPDAQRRTHADVMTTFAKRGPRSWASSLMRSFMVFKSSPRSSRPDCRGWPTLRWSATACETKFWPAGTFRTAYDRNRAEIVEALIEADPVASAVRLLSVRREYWEGQASDLDGILRAITGNLEGARNWPAEPRILANTLRQLAPSLMKIGIDVRFHKSPDRDRKRLITITASRRPDAAIKEEAISPSAASTKPAPGHHESHNGAGGDQHATAISSTTPNQPTVSEPRAQTADAADAGEIKKSTLSKTIPPNLVSKLRTLRRLKSRTRASKSFPIGSSATDEYRFYDPGGTARPKSRDRPDNQGENMCNARACARSGTGKFTPRCLATD